MENIKTENNLTTQYCNHCGAQITNNNKFCAKCGTPLNSDPIPPGYNGYPGHPGIPNTPKPIQPTAALVIEGIGLFFTFLAFYTYSDNHYDSNAGGLFGIGFIPIVISFVFFKIFKRKHPLTGLGYAGYVISCIALVFLVIAMILVLMLLFFAALRH